MYKIILKRIIDIIFSIIAIIVSIPIWIIAVIGIIISDPGPIFYISNRIGKDNLEFKMYKFRSMKILKEKREGCEASLRPEEDRIFPWGKFMRKFKLDEIPQFLNIFLGDMSFVGPRPVAKDQMSIFRTGRYNVAKDVKPGLTGPAALYDYIYGDEFEEININDYVERVLPTRKELEVVYVNKQSFIFDTWIIIETAICIFGNLLNKKNTHLLKKLVKLAQESDLNLN